MILEVGGAMLVAGLGGGFLTGWKAGRAAQSGRVADLEAALTAQRTRTGEAQAALAKVTAQAEADRALFKTERDRWLETERRLTDEGVRAREQLHAAARSDARLAGSVLDDALAGLSHTGAKPVR